MYAEVPRYFALYLRRQRLFRLLGISLLIVVVSVLVKNNNLVVAIGVPLANILMTLRGFNKTIFYHFGPHGISFSPKADSPGFTGLSGMSGGHWIYWKNDPLCESVSSHWKQHPALFIKTHKNQTGYTVPLKREDVDGALRFTKTLEAPIV